MSSIFIVLHGKAAGDPRVRTAVRAVRQSGHRVDVRVTWEGGAKALKFSTTVLKGAGGQGFFQPVAGIGDEAYIAPLGSTLMFRKGDVLVNIQLHMVGNNVDATKAIAQKIAARL